MAEGRSIPKRKDAVQTRERLVRAGLELFASAGFRATTTLEIAARATTAEATIYRHFAGKEALFNEAYRLTLRWGLGLFATSEAGRGPQSAQEQLGRIGRKLIQQAHSEPAMVAILLRPAGHATLDDQSIHLLRDFRSGLTQLIAAGKQAGSIRPGSADLWGSLWLAVVTFAAERVIAKEWTADHSSVGASLEAGWDAIAYRPVGPG